MPRSTSLSTDERRKLEHLRAWADYKWRSIRTRCPLHAVPETPGKPLDARSLVHMVKTASLAARDPTSDKIGRWIERYREHQRLDMHNVSTKRIQEIIHEHIGRIDEIFLFGLLTRKIEGPSGESRDVVGLQIHGTPNLKLLGMFSSKNDFIHIWLSDHRHSTYGLEEMIVTAWHEVAHAFISIFSDWEHEHHYRWSRANDGHGTKFGELLRFMLDTILRWTNSSRMRTAVKAEFEHCSQFRGLEGIFAH